jgi:hypothetical protein
MKMNRILYFSMGLALLFSACRKNDQDRSFYGDNQVFFAAQNGADSITYSFANYAAAASKDLLIPINIMGTLGTTTRQINISIDQQSSTALPGEYQLGQATVAAGTATGFLPIRLINTPRLENEKVQLVLHLENSGDFKVTPGSGKPLEVTKLRVVWLNILSRPADWPAQWGAYSRAKHRLVIELTGHVNFSGEDWVAGNYLYRVLGVCNEWLNEYDAAHPGAPYKNENGISFRFCASCP